MRFLPLLATLLCSSSVIAEFPDNPPEDLSAAEAVARADAITGHEGAQEASDGVESITGCEVEISYFWDSVYWVLIGEGKTHEESVTGADVEVLPYRDALDAVNGAMGLANALFGIAMTHGETGDDGGGFPGVPTIFLTRIQCYSFAENQFDSAKTKFEGVETIAESLMVTINQAHIAYMEGQEE